MDAGLLGENVGIMGDLQACATCQGSMCMPAVPSTFRRQSVYYWRRWTPGPQRLGSSLRQWNGATLLHPNWLNVLV